MDTSEHCCLDDCCGPGSWCCQHANPHLHEEDELTPVEQPVRAE